MASETLMVPVEPSLKARLDKMAQETGRSPATLAAEAIDTYISDNDWQIAGIHEAIASLDRDGGIDHQRVKAWVESWGTNAELDPPLP